jgi:hypothetical protein
MMMMTLVSKGDFFSSVDIIFTSIPLLPPPPLVHPVTQFIHPPLSPLNSAILISKI